MIENHMVLPGPWTGNPNDPNAPDGSNDCTRCGAEDSTGITWKPFGSELLCPDCYEKAEDEQKRADYADGLRQLADLIENTPGMVLPYEGTAVSISFMCHTREAFTATVRAFRKGDKAVTNEGTSFSALTFTPKDFPLKVNVHGFQDGIGCRRVVKGTRTVPETVIPAKPALPEQIIPAHEEEIVEWECGAILQETQA